MKKKRKKCEKYSSQFPRHPQIAFFFQLAVQKAKYFKFTNAIIDYKS